MSVALSRSNNIATHTVLGLAWLEAWELTTYHHRQRTAGASSTGATGAALIWTVKAGSFALLPVYTRLDVVQAARRPVAVRMSMARSGPGLRVTMVESPPCPSFTIQQPLRHSSTISHCLPLGASQPLLSLLSLLSFVLRRRCSARPRSSVSSHSFVLARHSGFEPLPEVSEVSLAS